MCGPNVLFAFLVSQFCFGDQCRFRALSEVNRRSLTARAIMLEAEIYNWYSPGGDSHMKQTGIFIVSQWGVNCGFWSRLGCCRQSANILKCL